MNSYNSGFPYSSGGYESPSDRRARNACVRLNQDAEECLRPHVNRIIGIFRGVWDEWNWLVEMSPYGSDYSTTLRARFIYDRATKQIERELGGLPNVQIDWEKGFFVIAIGGLVALRVKKVGVNRLACVNKTRQSNSFFGHLTLQKVLPYMEEYTPISAQQDLIPAVLAYQLDRLQSEIKDIAVICQYRDQAIFDLSLFDLTDDSSGGDHPVNTPEPPQPSGTTVKAVVRLPNLMGDPAETQKIKK